MLTSDCPVGAKRSFVLAGARAALAVAGVAAGVTALAACNPADEPPVRMGEELMGSPPVRGEWDGGSGGVGHPDYPEEFIMGDIALPPDQPLMGRIAPRSETE